MWLKTMFQDWNTVLYFILESYITKGYLSGSVSTVAALNLECVLVNFRLYGNPNTFLFHLDLLTFWFIGFTTVYTRT